MANSRSTLPPSELTVGPLRNAEKQETSHALAPTIFHEPWWLEVASAGSYQVAEVESGGKTVGRLPYLPYKRFGIPLIEMPMLTHFLGPALLEGVGSPNSRFLRQLGITRELIQKLPRASLTAMKLHYGISETIAFQEQGFRTSVQFTHEIDPLPTDLLWANLRNKTRNVIRRAEEQFQVKEVTDAAEFMIFYLGNLAARNMRSFLDRDICERLIQECIERGRGRILATYDGKALQAANFYIWDRRYYYFLLSTRSLTSGNGATSLLLWEAIKDSAQRDLIFDSDGLNSSGAILFFAGLGGTVKPRYIVSKSDLRGKLVETMRDAVWGKNFFVRG
jgi:hypothetical protein